MALFFNLTLKAHLFVLIRPNHGRTLGRTSPCSYSHRPARLQQSPRPQQRTQCPPCQLSSQLSRLVKPQSPPHRLPVSQYHRRVSCQVLSTSLHLHRMRHHQNRFCPLAWWWWYSWHATLGPGAPVLLTDLYRNKVRWWYNEQNVLLQRSEGTTVDGEVRLPFNVERCGHDED